MAAEVDGVGDKFLGYTTTADVQTLLEGFVIISLISAHFIDQFFMSRN